MASADDTAVIRLERGRVVEWFLALGGQFAVSGQDDWTLVAAPRALAVHYEHTVVATKRGALIVTLTG